MFNKMGRIKQGKHMNKSDITCWGGIFFSLFLMLVESVVRCLKMYNCHNATKAKVKHSDCVIFLQSEILQKPHLLLRELYYLAVQCKLI